MQKHGPGIVFWLLWLLLGPAAAQEGELRIAMSGAFAPFSTIDVEGTMVGFDADIARALAQGMGREAKLVQISWSGLQAGLKSGKYDLICGSMAITPARRENMAFSLPYYVSGAQVFGLGGKQPQRCGVTESSTYATYISAHPERFSETRVVNYGDEATILTAIGADKLDGFVSDRIVGGYYLSRSNASGIEPVGDLLYREACGIACRPDEPELLRAVNEALFALVNSGEYEEIYRRWVGRPPPT